MTEDRTNSEKPPGKALAPRFHPAHRTSAQHDEPLAVPAPELLRAVAGKSDVAKEQLEQQATELADHLRDRQRQLERREATLNARYAEHEAQQRTARLWVRERSRELDSQAAKLQQELRSMQEQVDENRAADRAAASLARKQRLVAQAEQALQEQRKHLDIELENVRHQAAWLEEARRSWQTQCQEEQRTLKQLRTQLLDQRQSTEQLNARLQQQLAENQRDSQQANQLRQLESESARIEQQQGELAEQRQAMARDQQLWRMRTAQQRRTIATLWRRRRQVLQQQHDALLRQQQVLHEQEDALQYQLNDLIRQRHEIAQWQLVVQQAHATLSHQVPPDQLEHIEQSVRQHIRSQLEAAARATEARKCELKELAESLQRQQETLKIRHTRLHTQVARRQSELDSRAARLAQWEQTLGERESR